MDKKEDVANLLPIVEPTGVISKDNEEDITNRKPEGEIVMENDIPDDVKKIIDDICSLNKNIEKLSSDKTKKIECAKLKQEVFKLKKSLSSKMRTLSDLTIKAIKEYQKTCVKESTSKDVNTNTLDFKRSKVEDLKKDLDVLKKMTSTDENDEKKRKIEDEINKLEEEIKKGEKEQKEKDESITEARKMEDEIKPIVDSLEDKGYKVKYASPGHPDIRKKDDRDRDGVYYGKLYSDARIMFDDKYDFPNAPDGWHWREVDGKSYLDISPKSANKDSDANKWKDEYMKSLSDYVKNLPKVNDSDSKEESKDDKDKEETEESVSLDSLYNDMMESVYNKILTSIDSDECTLELPSFTESAGPEIPNTEVTDELDNLFGL